MAASIGTVGYARASLWMIAAIGLLLSGCDTLTDVQKTFLGGPQQQDRPGAVKGFLGAVVADEPQAATVGRDVLASGGSAADAAVAIGLALSVTLPSRASLGAGGACLAYSPGTNKPDEPVAILFPTPAAKTVSGPTVDRPAGVPMLARGLYALYAAYGTGRFERLIQPAEQLARLGTPVSRALASDLRVVAEPLLADPNARAIFGPSGTPLVEGAGLIQPDLGGVLAQLRVAGVGDLYLGGLARRLVTATQVAGGPVTLADLRAALPRTKGALIEAHGRDKVAFLPLPADGGLAAAADLVALEAHPEAVARAGERGLAVAAQWRAAGGDASALLAASLPPARLGTLPASTTFATLDRKGHAVVCAVSMNNLFGTGRVAPGMGVVMAASPARVPPPLLSAAIAWNQGRRAFRAEVGGSGQQGAPLAVAAGLSNALGGQAPMPEPVPEPGRANVIACPGYLPGNERSCAAATDPRGAGLSLGGR